MSVLVTASSSAQRDIWATKRCRANIPSETWYQCSNLGHWQDFHHLHRCTRILVGSGIMPYPELVPNYPVFRGYKLTYSGMARNRMVTMFGLWRSTIWRGRDGGNALKDEVTPTPPLLLTWQALEMTIVIFENWTLHLAGFTMHPSDNGQATLQTR